MGAPAVLTALLAILGVWSSKPPTPPAASALIEPVSFFVGIKVVRLIIITSRDRNERERKVPCIIQFLFLSTTDNYSPWWREIKIE